MKLQNLQYDQFHAIRFRINFVSITTTFTLRQLCHIVESYIYYMAEINPSRIDQ